MTIYLYSNSLFLILQLDIKGAVDGDDISGQVQLGSHGTATFKGSRYVN